MDLKKLLETVTDKQKAMGRRDRTIKLKPGKNRVRILPGWRKGAEEVFFHDFGQHYIKDESGEMKAVYVCTEKTFGRPCAICSTLAKAAKGAADDTIVNLLAEAKASDRVLVNAILPDTDAATPVILELPPSVFRAVLDLFNEWGNFLDLAEGRDIIINREGTGLSTKYTVTPSAKASAVPASIASKIANLDEYVAQESTDGQNKAISAIASVSGAMLSAPAASTARALSAPSDVPATKITDEATANPAIEAEAISVDLSEDIEALLKV